MPAIETPPVELNWKAPNFHLKATNDKFYSLSNVRGEEGLLVMFICNHCPFVKAIADKIVRDTMELKSLGINSVAIMPNDTEEYPEDSFENMKLFHEQKNFGFPYLIDEDQKIAKAYGAVCTPDFFGFDADLRLQYRGRLDASGMNGLPDASRELFEAMKSIATTGRAPTTQKPSIGCSIKWK